ncbi:MAG: collagen-like protein [Oscillospiraceae bacterium]|jgi:hypothetical protein|nr:collagen-like protein [Oscillospiraceae bacterium]
MKKILLAIVSVALSAAVGLVGLGVLRTQAEKSHFESSGYVLQGDGTEVKRLAFATGDPYQVSRLGSVAFTSADGGRVTVPQDSFVHLDDGGVMALSGGVLLDFDDMSDNFINNYYISAGLPITAAGSSYTAQTSSGAVSFGENLWKLSDGKYLIQSQSLTVHFSDTDERAAEGYVKVSVTDDGIAQLLTTENLWTTISNETYIETSGGVRVYPMTQIVDGGAHKISVTKLAVSADDAIVLTKAELRRQIVPELNIEAINGQNGEGGESGEAGQAGEAGELGEAGEKGEVGEAGELGVAGTEGELGEAGESGELGENGKSGDKGGAGPTGGSGGAGRAGDRGTQGGDGGSGEGGGDGDTGAFGQGGRRGGDAVAEGSTNSALPYMSITEWNVTATTLTGGIFVDEETIDFLAKLIESVDTSKLETDYAAHVTVTDAATGEVYYCFQTYDTYDTSEISGDTTDTGIGGGNFAKAFGEGQQDVYYFALNPTENLAPDTRYVLSVKAYYMANDTIFQREFINRAFYTDSTGAFLSKEESKLEAGQSSGDPTTASLTVLASIGAEYQSVVKTVTVALLTPAQNAVYSQAATADYTAMFTIDYTGNGSITYTKKGDQPIAGTSPSDIYAAPLLFPELEANTHYIARVIVDTGPVKTLTNQQLDLMTLKLPPEKTLTGQIPSVNYNRVTGAFEVTRPDVKDTHAAVTEYVYTVYEGNKAVAERTVAANASGPVSFFLGPNGLTQGTSYTFGVTMKYYDNEKTLTTQLGTSDPVIAKGDSMPKLTLTVDGSSTGGATGTGYNYMAGTITIDLDASSGITLSPTNQLSLEIYGDGVAYDETPSMTAINTIFQNPGADTVNPGGRWTAEAVPVSGSANDLTINLSLKNLYKNTKYTITVRGWLNLGDDTGSVLRTIGSVSFRSTDAAVVQANWANDMGAQSSIASNLKLAPVAADQQTEDYAETQLQQGSVTVDLYSGTGAGKRLIASRTYDQTDNQGSNSIIDKLYSDAGYTITEQDFGNPSLNAATDYTLAVSGVTDQTYNMNLGYVNTFTMENQTNPIQATPMPPDLVQGAQGGVTATPILKKNASLYGVSVGDLSAAGVIVDRNLPDDTIIGYTLQANYDNEQRLGRRITYYAMEYRDFYNTIVSNRKDPLDMDTEDPAQASKSGANIIMQMTQPFDNSSAAAPGVAIIFNGSKTETQKDGDDGNTTDLVDTSANGVGPVRHNGMMVYYAGDPTGPAGTLSSGMGRGYRYVFAYTVEYTTGGSSDSVSVYPYKAKAYAEYRTRYGAGQQYGKPIGLDVAYVLNSGMCEAPKVAPDFHSYVYDTENAAAASGGGGASTGALLIDFKYRDFDGAIVAAPGSTQTQIIYKTVNNGTSSIPIYDQAGTNPAPVTESGSTGWFRVRIPYEGVTQDALALLEPYVTVNDYAVDYTDIMNTLKAGTAYADEDTKFYLCRVPLDYAWGDYFSQTGNDKVVYLTQMGYLDRNYILYKLTPTNTGAYDAAQILGERAFELKLTYTLWDDQSNAADSSNVTKVIHAPVTWGLSGVYEAKVTTGALGSEFLSTGKSFHVTAELLYDGGTQGWKAADDVNTVFGLQNVNRNDELGFFSYYNNVSGTSVYPSGGAMTRSNAFTTEQLRATVADTYKNPATGVLNDRKEYLATKYLTEQNLGRYLYPARLGVDTGGSNVADSLTNQYTVPKYAATYELTFDSASQYGTDTSGKTGKGEVTTMTPTIKLLGVPSFTSAQYSIQINDYEVNGYTQATPDNSNAYKVGARIYQNLADAQLFATNYTEELFMILKEKSTGVGAPKTKGDYDGSLSDGTQWTVADGLFGSSSGLSDDTTYYIMFYMNIGGNPVPLIDALTAEKAIYTVTTGTEVKFSSALGVTYYDNEYFDKYLQLIFNMSRYFGVTLKYDIYDEKGTAEVLSHDAMLADKILIAPTTLTDRNLLKIDLTPSTKREKLKPGVAYTLKITATEGNSPAGSAEFKFMIDPAGNNGAHIYVASATADTIRFQVTITDPQYSFMGQISSTGTQTKAGALYAVRFAYKDKTDGKLKRLYTVYDDDIFSGEVPKQPFELSDATIITDNRNPTVNGVTVKDDTEYFLYVFAVPDMDHNGLSDTGVDGTEVNRKEWEDFFTSEEDYIGKYDNGNNKDSDESCGAQFLTLIDSFWSDSAEDEAMASVCSGFKVAEKQQKTTDSNGIIVNKTLAAIDRVSSLRLRLVLAESFGILDGSNDQTFKRIDWSVSGTTNSQKSVNFSGTSLSRETDEMFKPETDGAGYDVYNYTIPQDVPAGVYTITIQLRQNENDVTPYETLSLVSRG